MAKKRPKRVHKPDPAALRDVRTGIAEAEKRERIGKGGEAVALLEGLARSHPRNLTVWSALFDLGGRLRDPDTVDHAGERILNLKADNPDLLFVLAAMRLSSGQPGRALESYEQFLTRFPDHPRAAEARSARDVLRAEVPPRCAALGLTGPDGPAALARHEQFLQFVKRGEFVEARSIAAKVLERYPHFVPTLNNLGELHYREGEFAQAIATARRVLESQPDNVHALANLIRYLTVTGHRDEASGLADRLRAARPEQPNGWAKKAEAFTCLGDDEAVLEVLRSAEADGRAAAPREEALLSHLAAVAAFRLGSEDDARRQWRDARRRSPGFSLAADSLADLDRPAEDQEGPWPFPMQEVLPEKVVRDLQGTARLARANDPEALARVLRRYLDEHAEVLGIVGFLLARGDPTGRDFALMVSETGRPPALMPALRDFALGRWGSHNARMRALALANQAGLVPNGPVRMWDGSGWSETIQFNLEIHDEPVYHHSEAVQPLVQDASQALYDGNGIEAERLLTRAAELEPGRPDIEFNLVSAYRAQERDAEAERLVRDLHARHPDYLFARAELARMLVKEGKLDEAEEMLRPLLLRTKMHRSEFRTFSSAQIELLLARGHTDAARSWLKMWEGVDRGHPTLEHYRKRIAGERKGRW
jgi:tetratricopeptide (TPR) repeat protein